MALTTSVLRDDAVAVVVLDGELDVAVARQVDSAVEECLDAGATAVVIDASRLVFCDSTGLGALLRAARRVGSGRFLLAGVSGAVARLVELTGCTFVLAIRQDVHAALEEVRGEAGGSLPAQRASFVV